MKNILLLIVLCLPLMAVCKEKDTKLVKEIREFYDEIDHSGMKTDYLFNRGFIGLNDLEDWYKGMPVIASPRKWKYLYESVQASLMQKQVLNDIDIIKPLKGNEINTANIQLLNYLGDYIRPTKIIKDKTKKQDYDLLHIFSGSMDNDFFSSGDVTFSFSPQDYFTNLDIKHSELYIDFCDLQGYRKVDLFSDQEYHINYDCIGEKSIIFRQIDKKDTIVSFCKINISGLNPEEKTLNSILNNQEKDNTISINKSSSIYVPSGLGVVYDEGADGKLDKPIIITEGFDIAGTMPIVTLDFLLFRVTGLKEYWENRVSSLKANGYDIFYIGFWNSTCALQENATRISNLIKSINNEKEGNFEGIYIGESMGGIIGRIALKEMENESYDHQIGLFVPYDSPFKGAYVPKGAQALVKAVADDLGIWAYEITALVDFFELVFGIDMPIVDIISQLESESASQMLVNHISEDNTHSNFQSFLSNLGYPEDCRNVAVVNGSNNVTYQQEAGPGDSLIYYKTWLGLNRYKFYAYYENAGENNQLLSKYIHYDLFPLGINYDVLKRDIDQMQYCNAPGSYISADINLLGVDTKFTFVPSLSALDIDPSIDPNGEFAYNISNKNNIINNGVTPFDDYYIDTDNTYHVSKYFDLNLFSSYIPSREIMYSDMYLQNRTINHDRDFEASITITVGNNTQPWGSDKHQDTGDFIINSGTTVNMKAGQSIKLKSGFKLNDGANFKLKIDPTGPTLKSTKAEHLNAPTINGSKFAEPGDEYQAQTVIEFESVSWLLIGNNYNYQSKSKEFSIPDNIPNGQLTLIANVNLNGKRISSSKVLIVKNESKEIKKKLKANHSVCKIYPNPAKTSISIELDKGFKEFYIEIKDIAGKTLIKQLNHNNGVQNIDISFLKNGFYIVEVKNKNKLIKTIKLLKQ